MNTQEAIRLLNTFSDQERLYISDDVDTALMDIKNLLQSLESENKKLKKEKWELEGINEACRKENEAYREMWEALWDVLELCTIYDSKRKGIQTYAEVILPELEQKYLGGGE